MIKSFKHKGLERLWTLDDGKAFQKKDAQRIKLRLAVIDSIEKVEDITNPAYKFHPLTGDRKGVYSLTVRANYRITFEFINGDAYILNYEDYH